MAKAKAAASTPAAGASDTTPVMGMDQYAANLNSQTPYNANQAAVRAYTRNAPYMADFMSNPQTMLQEMYRLQTSLQQNPNDPVSEYRLRVLRNALGDVFGMKAPTPMASYDQYSGILNATPTSSSAFLDAATTPRGR